jgi:CBS domain-containing protein
MSVGVVTVPPDAQAEDVARLMLAKEIDAVIVLEPEDGHAVGTISRDELVDTYAKYVDTGLPEDLTAAQIMREDIPIIPPDIPLSTAAQLMRDQKVRVFFLMHNAGGVTYPAAYISYKHLIRHFAAQDAEELKDLGIKASRNAPLDEFIARREAAKQRAQKK